MTNWKRVTGSQSEKPAEFDTTTSPHVVFQRRNIERVKGEDDETTLWEYDERVLTFEEYDALQREMTQEMAESANTVAGIAFVTLAEAGSIDDVTAGEHVGLFSPWEPGVSYTAGNLRRYNGQLYRCIHAHTSQEDWMPDVATSLWAKAADPTEEWPEWSQPVGAADAYNAGDKVSHNGKHWTSDVAANVWEPGVYGWTEEV